MSGLARAGALALVLAAASSCAGGDGGDGGEACSISLVASPPAPVRGQFVSVTAMTEVVGTSGARSYTWLVSLAGEPIVFEVISPDDTISFQASEAGVYEVSVSGTVGATVCSSDEISINATVPGAVFEDMVLRVVPRDPLAAPAQDLFIEVPGGAPYDLGAVTLSAGVAVDGVLRGPGGAPLAGYLRAAPLALEPVPLPPVEAFAGADGAFSLRLLGVAHDLLVMPDGGEVAPALLAGASVTSLDGDLALDAGALVTGTVTDASGDPVAGARVSLVAGGAPSTLAVTGADGSFALRARPGGPVAVTVAPEPGSGLPRLELDAGGGAAIATGSEIEIQYAALATRTVSPAVRLSDGATAAPGARVTWIAGPIAGAGQIAIDGAPRAAQGHVRLTAVAGAGGAHPATPLPRSAYHVLVEPGPAAPEGESVRVEEIDLVAGAPASLSLAAAAELTGTLVDDAGAPVAAARVTAAPLGLLAQSTAAGGAAISDPDGRFALPVAPGADYELRVDAAAAGLGRMALEVGAGGPGQATALGEVALPPVLRLSGEVALPGGGALAGASVELHCLACGADGGPAPVAQAVSDAAGRFVLLAPDPGVSP